MDTCTTDMMAAAIDLVGAAEFAQEQYRHQVEGTSFILQAWIPRLHRALYHMTITTILF